MHEYVNIDQKLTGLQLGDFLQAHLVTLAIVIIVLSR
jgi:hypothetical protein